MIKILFVCTGNTCRSPMAKALADFVFKEKGIEAEFESCGIYVEEGASASAKAISAVKELCDIDLSYHKAKKLFLDDIDHFDLVLTMTKSHKNFIINNYNGNTLKVMAYREYASEDKQDISDPYRMGLHIYKKCAEELLLLAHNLAEKIFKEA